MGTECSYNSFSNMIVISKNFDQYNTNGALPYIQLMLESNITIKIVTIQTSQTTQHYCVNTSCK